jgi:hypothetical protein
MMTEVFNIVLRSETTCAQEHGSVLRSDVTAAHEQFFMAVATVTGGETEWFKTNFEKRVSVRTDIFCVCLSLLCQCSSFPYLIFSEVAK